MYLASELASYALSEFERGIEGVTDDEAHVRLTKADGSKMNAISWIVAHIAWRGPSPDFRVRCGRHAAPYEGGATTTKLGEGIRKLGRRRRQRRSFQVRWQGERGYGVDEGCAPHVVPHRRD